MPDTTARTAWRDLRDYTVHAVEVPLAVWPEADRERVAEVFRTRPVALVVGADVPEGWQTVCGEGLPRMVSLDPSEDVTCADCLAAWAAPYVEDAERLLSREVVTA